MASVQMAAAAGIGGVIQGLFGTYQPASDGSYTVDVRDAPGLLVIGMNYVKQLALNYTPPLAPAAATVAAIVSSGALSNGAVAVTAQPDIARPVNVEVGTGTGAITAGNVAVTYIGNDGLTGTDNISAVCGASASTTQSLSRGVVTISSITVSGLTGGTSPWIRLSTTAAISVPVSQGAIDVAFLREYDAGATVAVGTPATALASIAPTNAPNGTRTYSFVYSAVSPVS
jgi:hypothetical protein